MAERRPIWESGVFVAAVLLLFALPAAPRGSAYGIAMPDSPGVPVRIRAGFSASLPLLLNSYAFSSTVQLTYGPRDAWQPALSPDNTQLVFVDASTHPEVWLASTSSGNVVNLTSTPDDDEDTPTFTPGGGSILFASDRSGDWDVYLVDLDGSNVRLAVGAAGSDEVHPALAPDGDYLVFSSNRAGNWDIYGMQPGDPGWTQLTDDPAADRLPSFSADGQAIVFRSERDGVSAAYRMAPDGSAETRVTALDSAANYPLAIPDASGVVYASSQGGVARLELANPAGAGVRQLWPRPGWSSLTPRVAGDSRAIVFAAAPESLAHDVYLSPFESPLYRIGAYGQGLLAGSRCDWEAGTWAYGLITVWQETGDSRYLDWVRNWIDGCIAASHPIGHVNDGLLGLAAISVWQAEGGAAHHAYALAVHDYLYYEAPRAADGALFHESDTIWDDTLLGVVPFMMAMGRADPAGAARDHAFARQQILVHAKHLQDSVTGLFRHGWDAGDGRYLGPHFWARGNGWAMVAMVEALRGASEEADDTRALLALLHAQQRGLVALQDETGQWPTIVDRPDFYREASGSALIGYGLRRAAAAGWLAPGIAPDVVRSVQTGAWRVVDADGRVRSVSAPTGPMATQAEYAAIPHAEPKLYGQGASLLLFAPLMNDWSDPE